MKYRQMLDTSKADEFAKKHRLNLKKSPFYTNKKTIVLDLDETLVHCSENNIGTHKISVKTPSGQVLKASIFIRPYLEYFLENLSNHFELILFTASSSLYVKPILELIDPKKKFFSHHVYRESCFKTKQNLYIKDLRVLGRDLKDIALVDNAAFSYALQVNNGIPIIPFYNSTEDRELLLLLEFLLKFNPNTKNRRSFINGEGKIDLSKVSLGSNMASSRRQRSRSRAKSKDISKGKGQIPEDQKDDFRPLLRDIFKMEYIIDPDIPNENVDSCLKRLLSMQ